LPGGCGEPLRRYRADTRIDRDTDEYSVEEQPSSKLSKQLFPHANYLIQLRMRASRIMAVNDPLMLKIAAAQDAIQSLCVEVHCLSCDPGNVGRKLDSGT